MKHAKIIPWNSLMQKSQKLQMFCFCEKSSAFVVLMIKNKPLGRHSAQIKVEKILYATAMSKHNLFSLLGFLIVKKVTLYFA